VWVRMRNRVVVVKRGAPVWRCEEFFFSRFIIDIIHIIRRYYIIEATRNRTKIHTRFRANGPPSLPVHSDIALSISRNGETSASPDLFRTKILLPSLSRCQRIS
jgi:hypothetical protein